MGLGFMLPWKLGPQVMQIVPLIHPPLALSITERIRLSDPCYTILIFSLYCSATIAIGNSGSVAVGDGGSTPKRIVNIRIPAPEHTLP